MHTLLNAREATRLTIEEVARAAGVTGLRSTTSSGSRSALLTAAFSDQGRLIGYDRVIAATALADPRDALRATMRELHLAIR